MELKDLQSTADALRSYATYLDTLPEFTDAVVTRNSSLT